AAPTDAAKQAQVGLARFAARDLAGAQAAADKALALAPGNARAWLLRGDLAMAKRDAKTALAAYEKGLAGGADGYDVRMRVGLAALRASDLDRALAEFERANQLDPQKSEPLEERASIFDKRHDNETARAELEKLVVVDPNAFAAAKKLTEAYLAMTAWP